MAEKETPKIKLPKKDYKKGDLPESKEEWVGYINKLHDFGVHQRGKYEYQWVVNIAYYHSLQHLIFNPKSGVIELPRDMKTPLTINRIGSFVESRMAKLTKNRPIPRVMPNTNDPVDVRGAKNADRALTYIWRKIDMETEDEKNTMMMLLCGTAFMRTVWDPFVGDYVNEIKKSSDGQDLIIDDDGSVGEDKIFLGEVSTKAISPFGILIADDSLTSIKDQPWIIERAHLPVSEVENIYPHLRGTLNKDTKQDIFTEHEKTVQRLQSSVFQGTGVGMVAAQDSLNSMALVKTYWQKPNYQYEKGVLAVVVNDQLAMINTWPNDYGDNVYPIVKFSERENGFHFWAQSTVERLIPIQRAYNKSKQQKAKNAALMANIKWMVPKGAGLMPESLTDEEGEVVEYNANVAAPHAAQLAPMPAYATEFDREMISDFRDVGGQRESSITPPPNLTAGVSIQIASELADEIIGPILRRKARSIEYVANTQLLIMNEEYLEPRKIKILGDTGKVDVQWMSALDFKNSTDVHIEVESMIPDFRGSKRQTLFDLWDRRIISDPEQLLEVLRYGNWDLLLEKREKSQQRVEEAIIELKKGKEPEITQFDNNMLFSKTLIEFVQSPEFSRLIPKRKAMLLQHLQKRLQTMMPQQGGPPGTDGAVAGQQNQAAVGTPFGAQVPAGQQGNSGLAAPQG